MTTTKNELLEEPVTILETHQLRTGYVHVRSDGIVYIRIYDDVEVDVEDSKEHYEIVKKAFNRAPGYDITELGLNSSVTKEVRDFANTIPVITKTEAIIVKSLV